MKEEDIYILGTEVRDFINQSRIKAQLLKNKPLFYQLCSCMDMLADSQQAIDAFGKEKTADKGIVYLQIFGLLQAIYLQQDATVNLAEALSFQVSLDDYPRLKEIREIRNDAAGHPTKRNEKKEESLRSWNFIILHSLSYDSFEIARWGVPDSYGSVCVVTKKVIEDQRKYICDILHKTLREIKKRDSDYKSKFNMSKISDTIHDSYGYSCEKMWSAIERADDAGMAAIGARSLLDAHDKFEKELSRRDIAMDTYPGIYLTFEELKYPLEKLNQHFSETSCLDKQTLNIFVYFVHEKMKELKHMAIKLDEEFTNI